VVVYSGKTGVAGITSRMNWLLAIQGYLAPSSRCSKRSKHKAPSISLLLSASSVFLLPVYSLQPPGKQKISLTILFENPLRIVSLQPPLHSPLYISSLLNFHPKFG